MCMITGACSLNSVLFEDRATTASCAQVLVSTVSCMLCCPVLHGIMTRATSQNIFAFSIHDHCVATTEPNSVYPIFSPSQQHVLTDMPAAATQAATVGVPVTASHEVGHQSADAAHLPSRTVTHSTIACCCRRSSCCQRGGQPSAACCCTLICQGQRHNMRTACKVQAAAVRLPGTAHQPAACCICCTSCCQC